MTSREALRPINRVLKKVRVGHAGTLDPLATGVLVVCVGPATRLISHIQEYPKTYLARFRLGLASDTEDISGQLESVPWSERPTAERLLQTLPQFQGTITQRPPAYSALKVSGKRAYQLARAGKTVELEPRPVQIHQLELLTFEDPVAGGEPDEIEFTCRIECGSGTYVRSLGRDLGEALGTAAVMVSLTRTAVGPFELDSAITLDHPDRETLRSQLLPPGWALNEHPQLEATAEDYQRLTVGKPLPSRENLGEPNQLVRAMDGDDRLLAVLRVQPDRWLHPEINFVPYWESVAV